jgi:hypothetical protein
MYYNKTWVNILHVIIVFFFICVEFYLSKILQIHYYSCGTNFRDLGGSKVKLQSKYPTRFHFVCCMIILHYIIYILPFGKVLSTNLKTHRNVLRYKTTKFHAHEIKWFYSNWLMETYKHSNRKLHEKKMFLDQGVVCLKLECL